MIRMFRRGSGICSAVAGQWVDSVSLRSLALDPVVTSLEAHKDGYIDFVHVSVFLDAGLSQGCCFCFPCFALPAQIGCFLSFG
jgi:hypothetical protein